MNDGLEAVRQAVKAIRARSYPGSSTENGKLYHDLPWRGLDKLRAHRPSTVARISQISQKIGGGTDRKILDVGCASGGLSIGFALDGAQVDGVDRDAQALDVARAAKKYLSIRDKALCFQRVDIDPAWAKSLPSYDVILWLSGFMWVRKEQGHEAALEVLWELSRRCKTLVFESAAADGEAAIPGATQTTVREWIGAGAAHEQLSSVPSPRGWYDRRVFFLEGGPKREWKGDTSRVTRQSRTVIEKTFIPGYEWMAPREAECLRRLEASPHFPRLLEENGKTLLLEFAGWSRDVSSRIINRDGPTVLDCLRTANIRHRDLRPSNLLALDGVLQVIDFGWALLDGELKPPKRDRLELNDREDGRGKWGGPDLDDRWALRRISDWLKTKNR